MYNGSSKHSHHISKIANVIPTVRVSTVGFQLLRGVIARFHCLCSMGEGEEERERERSVGGRQLAIIICTYLAYVSGVFV